MAAKGEIVLRRGLPMAAAPGQRVKLTARLKLEAKAGAYARILILARTSSAHRRYSDVASTGKIGSSRWTDAQLVADIPADSESADVRLELHGVGSAWFDDIAISLLGSAPHPDAATLSELQISNLVSLMRAATQIRYFHPSDQAASVDWNAFLPGAVARVLQIRDRSELRPVLEELFQPIAPTAEFGEAGQSWRSMSPAPGLHLTRWLRFSPGAGLRVGRDPEEQQLVQKTTRLSVSDPASCAGAELHASAQLLEHRGKVELYLEQLLPAERKSVKAITITSDAQEYRVPIEMAPDVQGVSVKVRLTGFGGVVLRDLSLSCAHRSSVAVPLATSRWTTAGTDELNQDAAHTSSPDDVQAALSRLVGHLPDSHGRVIHPDTQPAGILPIAFRQFGSKLLAYSAVREYAAQVPVGSEVLEIRGVSAVQALRRVVPLVAAATDNARRFFSESRLRLGALGSFAKLRIRTMDGRVSEVVLPYVSRDLYNLGIPYEWRGPVQKSRQAYSIWTSIC